MPPTNVSRIMRKLALNPRAAQSARLHALKFLGTRMSFRCLEAIVSDKTTSGRVAAYAARLYSLKAAQLQMKELPTCPNN